MRGRKASAACQACHKPSKGVVAYLCRPKVALLATTENVRGDVHTLAPAVQCDVGGVAPQSNRFKYSPQRHLNEPDDTTCHCVMRVHGHREVGLYCCMGRLRARRRECSWRTWGVFVHMQLE
eukprot:scaffold656_cov403-Pavlova_lutheri.AAC.23